MARKNSSKKPEIVGLLGVAFDHEDGHRRVTQGEQFVLVGGSEETHERMQDVAIHVTEALKERGKQLRDAAPEEVVDLLREAADR